MKYGGEFRARENGCREYGGGVLLNRVEPFDDFRQPADERFVRRIALFGAGEGGLSRDALALRSVLSQSPLPRRGEVLSTGESRGQQLVARIPFFPFPGILVPDKEIVGHL